MTQAPKKSFPRISPYIAKGSAMVLGLVFIAAAAAKTADMNEAVRQAGAYAIVSDRTLLLFLVWALVAAEFAVGAALILRYRVRLALTGAAVMLAVFFGALAWAWGTGVTEDCGCFGQWSSRSPGQAFIEDLVLLLLLFLAWFHADYKKSPVKLAAVIAALLIPFGLPFAFGFSFNSMIIPGAEGPPVEPLPILSGEVVDWSGSPYLIELMSTDCLHCQQSVMDVNILADTPGAPPVMAMTYDSPEAIAEFRETYFPEYPTLRIPEEPFWRLVGAGASPRFLLVVQGRVVHAWEEAPPLGPGAFGCTGVPVMSLLTPEILLAVLPAAACLFFGAQCLKIAAMGQAHYFIQPQTFFLYRRSGDGHGRDSAVQDYGDPRLHSGARLPDYYHCVFRRMLRGDFQTRGTGIMFSPPIKRRFSPFYARVCSTGTSNFRKPRLRKGRARST